MKFMIILYLFSLASASSKLQSQEEGNKQHLDPLNDPELPDGIKQQMKRTLIGIGPYTYASNYGAAKHVGVHPLGFKYLLGYGPLGYVPLAKPDVTVLKPLLHTHGWKPIIPIQTVPFIRPLHIKPVVPFVHSKPHFITPVQPVGRPILDPGVSQTPTILKPVWPQSVPAVYPFYKQLVPVHSPVLPPQPPVVQSVIPQIHLQPPLLRPQTPIVQPLNPAVLPQIPVQQPIIPQQYIPQQYIPQQYIPQQIFPVQPQLFHFLKHFQHGPFFKQITPLFPAHVPQLPVPELPRPPVHTPMTTHDTGISVQIPTHLPDHPHFRPMVNVIPQGPVQPDFDEQGVQGHTPFGIFPQPQPDFGTGQQGETETTFIVRPQVPTHPAPQTPLYLPPHPVFRPGVANPVGPIEPTNSVHTEFSATFPKHPFVNGIHHNHNPSITLEPPYGPGRHLS